MATSKRSAATRTATKATKPKAAAKTTKAAAPKRASKPAAAARTPKAAAPKLLAGGNPQIPKGYGDAPVQTWIAAVPGWKRDAAARLDALVTRAVPGVRKAVKWNSPLYGVGEDNVWFMSLHVYANYIKVAFFAGRDLSPMPPGESKMANTRYLNLREGELDEAQFVDWVTQASKLPGERM